MSNTLRKFVKLFYVFSFSKIPFLSLALTGTVISIVASGADFLTVDRERLADVSDDSPLARSGDREAWNYLFGLLRNHSSEEIDRQAVENVGFTELDRQPVEYRGRFVRFSGCLLRCEFVPLRREPGPFDDPAATGKHGFYESWVLLKDKKDVPVSVCSLEIPSGFPTGDDLKETVSVTGIFYKRQLFLSDKEEEVVTPTILAKTFRWTPSEQAIPGEKTPWWKSPFGAMLGVLAILWVSFHLMSRRLFPSRRPPLGGGRFLFFGTETKPGDEPVIAVSEPSAEDKEKTSGDAPDKTIKIVPMILALVLSVASTGGAAEESGPPKINAEFTRMLTQMDELTWDTLGSEEIPLEQQRETVFDMMDRLRKAVPASFLKNGISGSFKPGHSEKTENEQGLALVDDPAQYLGKAFELQGFVQRVEEIPLNPAEKKTYALSALYRCRFIVPGQGCADVLASFVPSQWKRDEAIREKAAFTGIYIKRIRFDEKQNDDEVRRDDSSLRSELLPLLITPHIQWFPNTFLGNLGFDVGSFDLVPALRISDLKKKSPDVPEPYRLLDRNEVMRRAFKFTEADTEPFYGLLKAAAATPPGRIGQEARLEQEQAGRKAFSVIELFNDPAAMRGKPVLLHGIAKRVLPTLVENSEARKLYGIERYYQVYFYTDDSQGNPLVACVTSLPDGMPTGSASDYAERITIAAIPYKLWVYNSSDKLEGDEGYKPGYAPLMVGRSLTWHPSEKEGAKPLAAAGDSRTTISFTVFFLLMIVWIFFRRFKSRRSIEFKWRNR